MNFTKIAIIGGGNLGSAIARGILSLEGITNKNLVICEKRKLRIKYLEDLGFSTVDTDIKKAIHNAEMIIVSVKPQQFASVLEELKPILQSDQILVSTATGINLTDISNTLGKQPIVRIMPNTAIEIKESMTCICFRNTTKEQEEKTLALFEQLGKTIILQEDLLDAVTVLGACGIAFALRFIRAATQGGIEIGFSAEISEYIVSQTVKGAAQLLHENNSHPEAEIDKVTTPQGITISGLNEMEHQGFSSSVIKGLITSYNKLIAMEKNNY
ncbi:MAG: pyrroline-5-carboxylate reductase [Bacteroidales bacterium]|jgi:pyrroline-5-carboxylate reductase|nr:pyrroline-5-carboxylate reductase [Bacteroidales bacterium]